MPAYVFSPRPVTDGARTREGFDDRASEIRRRLGIPHERPSQPQHAELQLHAHQTERTPLLREREAPVRLRPVRTGRALTAYAGLSNRPSGRVASATEPNIGPTPRAPSRASPPTRRSQPPAPPRPRRSPRRQSPRSRRRRRGPVVRERPRARIQPAATAAGSTAISFPLVRRNRGDAVRVGERGVWRAEQPRSGSLRLAPRHGDAARRLGERAGEERGPSLGVMRPILLSSKSVPASSFSRLRKTPRRGERRPFPAQHRVRIPPQLDRREFPEVNALGLGQARRVGEGAVGSGERESAERVRRGEFDLEGAPRCRARERP